jgi:stringent starvation protein B
LNAVPPSQLPPKKDVLLALLEQSTVRVHLDPRAAEVRVPSWFKKQPQLALDIGLNLPVPIRDLDLGEEGVSCTLSFNRSPHFCFVPWSAIFALVDQQSGRGMLWPESVPPEVTVAQQTKKPAELSKQAGAKQAATAQVARGESATGKAVAKKGAVKRPALRAVPGDVSPLAAVQGSVDEPATAPSVAAAAATVEAATGDAPAEPTNQPMPVAPAAQKAARPSYLRVVK